MTSARIGYAEKVMVLAGPSNLRQITVVQRLGPEL